LKNKIIIVPYALSNQKGEAEFTVLDGTLVGSSMVLPNNGRKEKANLISIDEYCIENNIAPTFIKADIEGAERMMLAGAKKILQEQAPKLSICTYHLPDDKTVLRKLILDGNANYKITEKWKKYYATTH